MFLGTGRVLYNSARVVFSNEAFLTRFGSIAPFTRNIFILRIKYFSYLILIHFLTNIRLTEKKAYLQNGPRNHLGWSDFNDDQSDY